MLTQDMLEKQRNTACTFNRVMKEYTTGKEQATKKLQDDKAAAEDSWKKAQQNNVNVEATANNTRLKEQRAALSEIEYIHGMYKHITKTVDASAWKTYRDGGNVYLSENIQGKDLTSQLYMYRLQGYQASQDIEKFLKEQKVPNRGDAAGTAAAVVFIIFIAIASFIGLAYHISDSNSIIFLSLFTVIPTALVAFYVYKRPINSSRYIVLRNAYATLTYAVQRADELYQPLLKAVEKKYQREIAVGKEQLKNAEKEYQRQLAESQVRYDRNTQIVEQKFQRELAVLKEQCIRFIDEGLANSSGWGWNDARWGRWTPTTAMAAIARVGTLVIHKDLPTIPAFVVCPGGQNIVFKASGAGKESAASAIKALMARLLATNAPGSIRFTLIDPDSAGRHVATFTRLKDLDEDLVGSKVWIKEREITGQLDDVEAQMADTIQRLDDKTLVEYNAKAEVPLPYHIIVVMGFPSEFSTDAVKTLMNIAVKGMPVGFSVVMMQDIEQPFPYNANTKPLEDSSKFITFTWDGTRFVWQDNDFKTCRLNFDVPPAADLFNRIVQEVGTQSGTASRIIVPFDRYVPVQWWDEKNRTDQELSVELGLRAKLSTDNTSQPLVFTLNSRTEVGTLVAGQAGSGKTNMMLVMIMGLALKYSPDELELYIVDLKEVGFTPYIDYKLPHARVVATKSEREYAMSVLERVAQEMKNRQDLFSVSGQRDIIEYRRFNPNKRMPRVLLIVDEFQELFIQEDAIANEAKTILSRLVRIGRAFGIHVLLGSQTLRGPYSIPGETISQMSIRIAFRSDPVDAEHILNGDNTAVKMLARYRSGEGIYNQHTGADGKNENFQCAYLDDDTLDSYLQRLQSFAQIQPYTQLEQVFFKGDANADITNNIPFARLLRAAYPATLPRAISVWLGEPIAIRDATAARFRAAASNHLLLVGQQAELALGLFLISLLTLAAQHAPGSAQFYIADFSFIDAEHADKLKEIAQLLPRHNVTVVRRHGLASVINSVAETVKERTDEGLQQPVYLFIYGLQSARDLREDDDYRYSSYSSSDEETTPPPPSLSKQFATILHDGADVGVHTLVWCDTMTNFNRILESRMLRDFEMRVAFQMAAEDSRSVIDTDAANRLDSHRAIFFNETTGQLEKFRPYGLPTDQWLRETAELINKKP